MTFHVPWKRLWAIVVAHRGALFLLFVAVLLPLYAFSELAGEVLEQEAFVYDDPFLLFAHSLMSPQRDAAMLLMSKLGYQWGVLPLDVGIACWLLLRSHRRDALFFGLSVGGAALLNQAAKLFFGRERPKLWVSLAPEPNASFPSGHAMGSMALVAALIVLLWPTRWRYAALLIGGAFVGLVGFSRIYLGVHYPSDVIAGWLAALAWVMGLSLILYNRFGKWGSAEP